MAVFHLRNTRNPNSKIVPVTVALNSEVVVEAEPNEEKEGDNTWILIVATREPDINGDPIPPEIINIVSKETVHLELEAAIGRIGSKIDWGDILPDNRPPRLKSLTPSLEQTEDVPIDSNITIRLQDPFPAAGIDLSTLNMKLNGFPIIINGVPSIGEDVVFRGNPVDLTVIHRPKRIN